MSIHLVITNHARDRIQERLGVLDPIINAIRGENYRIYSGKKEIEILIPGLGKLLACFNRNCLIAKTFIYAFFSGKRQSKGSPINEKITLISFKT